MPEINTIFLGQLPVKADLFTINGLLMHQRSVLRVHVPRHVPCSRHQGSANGVRDNDSMNTLYTDSNGLLWCNLLDPAPY